MSAITSSVQQRDIKVFEWMADFGQQSLRKIAKALGIKSSQVQQRGFIEA
jgi:hypothetical protein